MLEEINSELGLRLGSNSFRLSQVIHLFHLNEQLLRRPREALNGLLLASQVVGIAF